MIVHISASSQQHEIFFIVDEVQTGCGATGTFWAHEQWGLEEPPDIVTFSKKMQAAGYFLRKGPFTQSEPGLIMNTWMGEATKLLLLEAIYDVMEQEELLSRVRATGSFLLAGLEVLQVRHDQSVRSNRLHCMTGKLK